MGFAIGILDYGLVNDGIDRGDTKTCAETGKYLLGSVIHKRTGSNFLIVHTTILFYTTMEVAY